MGRQDVMDEASAVSRSDVCEESSTTHQGRGVKAPKTVKGSKMEGILGEKYDANTKK